MESIRELFNRTQSVCVCVWKRAWGFFIFNMHLHLKLMVRQLLKTHWFSAELCHRGCSCIIIIIVINSSSSSSGKVLIKKCVPNEPHFRGGAPENCASCSQAELPLTSPSAPCHSVSIELGCRRRKSAHAPETFLLSRLSSAICRRSGVRFFCFFFNRNLCKWVSRKSRRNKEFFVEMTLKKICNYRCGLTRTGLP